MADLRQLQGVDWGKFSVLMVVVVMVVVVFSGELMLTCVDSCLPPVATKMSGTTLRKSRIREFRCVEASKGVIGDLIPAFWYES
jgi:hypothetical protein